MRTLSLAQVRIAGLPAQLRLGQLTYEYRPALGSVVVFFGPTRRPCLSLAHRIPAYGWLHEADCRCPYCQVGRETSKPCEAPLAAHRLTKGQPGSASC
jgi:hypothetical protein